MYVVDDSKNLVEIRPQQKKDITTDKMEHIINQLEEEDKEGGEGFEAETELAPEQADEEDQPTVYAVLECSKFGRVLDPNFQSQNRVSNLYQVNDEGKLVQYDRLNPIDDRIFGLVELDENNQVTSDEYGEPLDPSRLERVQVDIKANIQELPRLPASKPQGSKNESVISLIQCKTPKEPNDPDYTETDQSNDQSNDLVADGQGALA